MWGFARASAGGLQENCKPAARAPREGADVGSGTGPAPHGNEETITMLNEGEAAQALVAAMRLGLIEGIAPPPESL